MYKYYDKNENDDISLHDCRATAVSLKNKKLAFTFPDGFFVCDQNKQNPYGKTLCTDQSEIEFQILEEDVTVYIFSRKMGKTIREEWEIRDYIEKINDHTYELEFLYKYKGYQSMIFECMIWFNKKPYCKECVLMMRTEDITYRWNQLCEDREW